MFGVSASALGFGLLGGGNSYGGYGGYPGNKKDSKIDEIVISLMINVKHKK